MVPIDCPLPHDQSSMPTIVGAGGEVGGGWRSMRSRVWRLVGMPCC
jgi:hypothetical protein